MVGANVLGGAGLSGGLCLVGAGSGFGGDVVTVVGTGSLVVGVVSLGCSEEAVGKKLGKSNGGLR